MQKTITTKYVALFALLALAFTLALPAYAYDELEIEIEITTDGAQVEIEYEKDGVELEKEFEYSTADLDELYVLIGDQLDISADEVEAVATIDQADQEEPQAEAKEAVDEAKDAVAEAEVAVAAKETDRDRYLETAQEYLAKATTAYENEQYDDAIDWAEKAEDKAEYIVDEADETDKKSEDKKWTEEKCESNPGIGDGVLKKCDGDYKEKDTKKVKSDMTDRFKDFGKTSDRTELQSQLQELMQLLIQLLTMQLAQQSS